MIAEIGQFALVLGLLLALVQAVLPWLGLRSGNRLYLDFAGRVATGQCAFLLIAFMSLTAVHVLSDFTVLNVVQNSHTTKPLVYKISGVWGNHEGSMLLWVLVLAIFGAVMARKNSPLAPGLKYRALATQGLIGFAFIAFLIFTSNPFERIFPAPINGQGLNPLLQDPGLAIHPPLLYLGYVGLSTAFSLSAAGLLEGKIDRAWAQATRPWVLAAWGFLTLGIGLGSWWAYNELGWGGWWFWDPVENASFMPWLFATALFHSLRVVEKREALKTWTALLAILAFSFSLIGTFLVRSGILTSVHAFATDPGRGVFLLVILTAAIGGALALFGSRAPKLKPKSSFGPVSREGAILINNLFIVSAALTVFLGTFYPLFIDAITGNKISVGAPYFNLTFLPIMIPALLLLGAAGRLTWKKASAREVLYSLRYAMISALVIGLILAFVAWPGSVMAIFGVSLGVWIGAGTLMDLLAKAKLKGSFSDIMSRLARLPKAAWGMAVAHFGVAVIVIAITGTSFWQEENIALMRPGERMEAGDLTLVLNRAYTTQEVNYQALRGEFSIFRGPDLVTELSAEKRFYPVRGMETTEAGVHTTFWADLYVTLGQQGTSNALAVHFFKNPLIPWLWTGGLLLVLGGGLTLLPSRPKPATKKAPKKAAKKPAVQKA